MDTHVPSSEAVDGAVAQLSNRQSSEQYLRSRWHHVTRHILGDGYDDKLHPYRRNTHAPSNPLSISGTTPTEAVAHNAILPWQVKELEDVLLVTMQSAIQLSAWQQQSGGQSQKLMYPSLNAANSWSEHLRKACARANSDSAALQKEQHVQFFFSSSMILEYAMPLLSRFLDAVRNGEEIYDVATSLKEASCGAPTNAELGAMTVKEPKPPQEPPFLQTLTDCFDCILHCCCLPFVHFSNEDYAVDSKARHSLVQLLARGLCTPLPRRRSGAKNMTPEPADSAKAAMRTQHIRLETAKAIPLLIIMNHTENGNTAAESGTRRQGTRAQQRVQPVMDVTVFDVFLERLQQIMSHINGVFPGGASAAWSSSEEFENAKAVSTLTVHDGEVTGVSESREAWRIEGCIILHLLLNLFAHAPHAAGVVYAEHLASNGLPQILSRALLLFSVRSDRFYAANTCDETTTTEHVDAEPSDTDVEDEDVGVDSASPTGTVRRKPQYVLGSSGYRCRGSIVEILLCLLRLAPTQTIAALRATSPSARTENGVRSIISLTPLESLYESFLCSVVSLGMSSREQELRNDIAALWLQIIQLWTCAERAPRSVDAKSTCFSECEPLRRLADVALAVGCGGELEMSHISVQTMLPQLLNALPTGMKAHLGAHSAATQSLPDVLDEPMTVSLAVLPLARHMLSVAGRDMELKKYCWLLLANLCVEEEKDACWRWNALRVSATTSSSNSSDDDSSPPAQLSRRVEHYFAPHIFSLGFLGVVLAYLNVDESSVSVTQYRGEKLLLMQQYCLEVILTLLSDTSYNDRSGDGLESPPFPCTVSEMAADCLVLDHDAVDRLLNYMSCCNRVPDDAVDSDTVNHPVVVDTFFTLRRTCADVLATLAVYPQYSHAILLSLQRNPVPVELLVSEIQRVCVNPSIATGQGQTQLASQPGLNTLDEGYVVSILMFITRLSTNVEGNSYAESQAKSVSPTRNPASSASAPASRNETPPTSARSSGIQHRSAFDSLPREVEGSVSGTSRVGVTAADVSLEIRSLFRTFDGISVLLALINFCVRASHASVLSAYERVDTQLLRSGIAPFAAAATASSATATTIMQMSVLSASQSARGNGGVSAAPDGVGTTTNYYASPTLHSLVLPAALAALRGTVVGDVANTRSFLEHDGIHVLLSGVVLEQDAQADLYAGNSGSSDRSARGSGESERNEACNAADLPLESRAGCSFFTSFALSFMADIMCKANADLNSEYAMMGKTLNLSHVEHAGGAHDMHANRNSTNTADFLSSFPDVAAIPGPFSNGPMREDNPASALNPSDAISYSVSHPESSAKTPSAVDHAANNNTTRTQSDLISTTVREQFFLWKLRRSVRSSAKSTSSGDCSMSTFSFLTAPRVLLHLWMAEEKRLLAQSPHAQRSEDDHSLMASAAQSTNAAGSDSTVPNSSSTLQLSTNQQAPAPVNSGGERSKSDKRKAYAACLCLESELFVRVYAVFHAAGLHLFHNPLHPTPPSVTGNDSLDETIVRAAAERTGSAATLHPQEWAALSRVEAFPSLCTDAFTFRLLRELNSKSEDANSEPTFADVDTPSELAQARADLEAAASHGDLAKCDYAHLERALHLAEERRAVLDGIDEQCEMWMNEAEHEAYEALCARIGRLAGEQQFFQGTPLRALSLGRWSSASPPIRQSNDRVRLVKEHNASNTEGFALTPYSATFSTLYSPRTSQEPRAPKGSRGKTRGGGTKSSAAAVAAPPEVVEDRLSVLNLPDTYQRAPAPRSRESFATKTPQSTRSLQSTSIDSEEAPVGGQLLPPLALLLNPHSVASVGSSEGNSTRSSRSINRELPAAATYSNHMLLPAAPSRFGGSQMRGTRNGKGGMFFGDAVDPSSQRRLNKNVPSAYFSEDWDNKRGSNDRPSATTHARKGVDTPHSMTARPSFMAVRLRTGITGTVRHIGNTNLYKKAQ